MKRMMMISNALSSESPRGGGRIGIVEDMDCNGDRGDGVVMELWEVGSVTV